MMRAPPVAPNAHLPLPYIEITLEGQTLKEAILLIFALRWFICLSSTDIISTLTQYYAANPGKRPSTFPRDLDSNYIHTVYHSLEQIIQPPYTVEMRYYAECMTDLGWRRLAANVYRAHRPENEAGPLPSGFVQTEDRQIRPDYTMLQPVDMNQIDEYEGSRLCIALRTWIGECTFALLSYGNIMPLTLFQYADRSSH